MAFIYRYFNKFNAVYMILPQAKLTRRRHRIRGASVILQILGQRDSTLASGLFFISGTEKHFYS